MNVIYMAKNKNSAIDGLLHLINSGVHVSVVVGPEKLSSMDSQRIIDVASEHNIPTTSDDELYECLRDGPQSNNFGFSLDEIDLVISFLFWKRIRKPLIDLPKIGCINFHPAPLPDFRGVGGYNFAIYENHPEWGVSAHFVDESFDTGELIKVNRFPINPEDETAFSLEQRSQIDLLALFKEVIELCINGRSLPKLPQTEGRYIDTEEFEAVRKITPDNTLEEVERKIRAFWYPPYDGALMNIQGSEFTVIDRKLLSEIAEKYHR